jgi:hypothetical protein
MSHSTQEGIAMGHTDWGNLTLAAAALLGVVGLFFTFGHSLVDYKRRKPRRRR